MEMTAEQRRWTSLAEVLHEELKDIRPDWNDVPQPPPELCSRAGALRAVYAAIASHARASGGKLSALCLSGGGIRSATFNLGVLQALARADLLHRFDYLSTVSGGGYIGSWLQSWIARERENARKPPPSGQQALRTVEGDARPETDARCAAPLRTRDGAAEPTEAERLRAARVDPLQVVMRLLCRPGRTPRKRGSARAWWTTRSRRSRSPSTACASSATT
jgi:hypothetical protein